MIEISKILIYRVSILLLMIATFIPVNHMFVASHEKIHEVIMKDYGCNEVIMEVNLFSGSTSCIDRSEISTEDRQQEILLHGINEIVGYTIRIILLYAYITTLLVISFFMFQPFDEMI